MKRPAVTLAVIAVVAVVVIFSGRTFFPPVQGIDEVCIRKRCVEVETVRTPEERKKGLMHRDALPEDHGMLFIFEKSAPYGFWMKNTLIPLDIIWIDYANRIVHIEKNVPPCESDPCPTYKPETDALYVLEVNAGIAQKNGWQMGDRVEMKLGIVQ